MTLTGGYGDSMVSRTRKQTSAVVYDPGEFPPFAVTVDLVVFCLIDDELNVLLVKRLQDPFAGRWALPGGFKLPDETLDGAASRELREETRVQGAALTQLHAYGDPGRDPRMNVVTVAYLAVLAGPVDVHGGSDAEAAAWHPVASVLDRHRFLAFDHVRILGDALERIRSDAGSNGVVLGFLAPTFTLSTLRSAFEAVWGCRLDPANFRRKLTTDPGWVQPTGRWTTPGTVGGRPAEQFRAGRSWRTGSPVRRPTARPRHHAGSAPEHDGVST